MKKMFLLLLLVSNLFVQCQARHSDFVPLADTTYLLPTKDLEREAKNIAYVLSQVHYSKINFDDSLSGAVLNNYLETLDPYKIYFLKKDIKSFQKYSNRLDNDLKAGRLDAAYDIYNTFRQRFDERLEAVDSLQGLEFDFTKDEYYQADRKEADWASSPKELDEVWRKILKNQALSYKLTDKEWPYIKEQLVKRYDRIRKNVSQQKTMDVFQLFMNAVATAYDPHTSYFSPRSSENFNISMSKALEGIGASLTTDGDYTKVAEVIAGGPAFKSKLIFKDDRIIGVAQGDEGEMVDVIGWRLDDVVQLIRGPKDSKVRLNILRAADGANALPVEITLVRDKVKLEDQVAKGKIVPVTEEGKTYQIGVITIPDFYIDFEAAQSGDPDYISTTRDVRRIIQELEAEGMDGLVIDLTFNGGGSLAEAIELTGLFIPQGPVVQVRNTKGKVETGDDPDPSTVYEGPLAVVVNRFSASASEIFAGAIQDYKRGVVIGEQTFGKGTVQNLWNLDQITGKGNKEQGQLKVTTGKFYRVTGSSTQHRGVTPDIELPSQFGATEFGESSYPSALPWDQIPTSRFEQTRTVNERMLRKLQNSYEQRLLTDADLIDLREDIERSKKLRETTLVSLNFEKRKQEMEELKGRDEDSDTLEEQINNFEVDEVEPVEEVSPKKLDPYVKETVRIVAEILANK